MKIYGVSGSRAQRTLWAAEEMKLDYEHVPTNFMEDSKKPEYLAINPNGRVPAMVDGDLVLFESMAINLYLARRYGGELWPASDADQARAVQWSFWGIAELEHLLIEILMNRVMLPEAERNAALADADEQKAARPLLVLDAHLADRDYVLGPNFTIADVNVAGVLVLTQMTHVDLGPYPNVKDWLERCTSRPAALKARSL
jgi:glutathione S-transferase